MKSALKIAPLVLALAAVAMPAAARDNGRGHDRQHQTYSRRDDRRRDGDDRRWSGRDQRWADRDRDGRSRHEHWNRPPSRVVYRPAPRVVYRPGPRVVYHPSAYRGAPPWARGRDYRSYGYNNVYYVPYNDYYRYDLYQPRHGYRWVRDDYGNFLLVAAATGIITSILMNHAY